MIEAIFPITFGSEELRLLTAIGLGFMFGFSLERAGFGNARKLAGQFYFNDMTVFKVMFTAILVAMVGLYSLSAIGLLDMTRMWINPTFMWAQLVGGFMLGVGFIMSGLCPGTSVVSAASGRWDGLVTFSGIFVGSFLFAVMLEWFPVLERLYTGGSLGDSVLPALLRVPTPLFILGVVAMAGAAFVAAERVEQAFRRRREPVELTPEPTRHAPRYKFAVAGGLVVVGLLATGATAPEIEQPDRQIAAIAPLQLADDIISGNPGLVILDLRQEDDTASGIPGAIRITTDRSAQTVLLSAGQWAKVVVYDEFGDARTALGTWPQHFEYRFLSGGLRAWRAEVMTPAEPAGHGSAEREFIARQNQIAAFFSGTAARPTPVAAPPVVAGGTQTKKKKSMGC
ncbi:MAG: YeeE/YedE family protein [Gemmatimonadota bacterium]|nr:MAG: YeeE/YedE family protein [Gemmatimonadota bacterium]